MLWYLSLRTLLFDRGKLLTGLVGVVFSVILVNVQGGLFYGLISKASYLVDRSQADIWVGSYQMHNVDFPHDVPARWLQRIRSIPGVAEADPIRIGFSEMSLPDGGHEGVTVVGIMRDSSLGRSFEVIQGNPQALADPLGIVVDECDDEKLQYPALGEIREIGGKRTRVVAKSRGVLSFLVTPYVFTTLDRAADFIGSDRTLVSYFLVRTVPGANKAEVCREIDRRLPSATAMTAQDYANVSINFWTTRTGIGLSFGAAAGLGLLVGLVMVGQTLYAMVLDRISEYATLKAIGATEREIITLLTLQSATIAIVGICLGTVLSFLIGLLLSTPRTTIAIPAMLYVGSGLLVFTICLLAAGLPYLRVRSVDAHTVLQGS
ncbi:ABC transporter permease [Aureliella helgolandensis]|uniref:FtsX-like permease family protein n=1 Tax=Aureliella helgolandensis TaxID=2527968 RepID=A0A518GE22_9BACT|nr:ABC transporter permease [Aureliella helgolandensis]QDV26846.1 FtsX-like permease family protein [Aureliella helgolandensis]